MDCKYDIKIYDDKPYENIKTEKSKIINIEIRYKTSLEAYNFKNYIKREENIQKKIHFSMNLKKLIKYISKVQNQLNLKTFKDYSEKEKIN